MACGLWVSLVSVLLAAKTEQSLEVSLHWCSTVAFAPLRRRGLPQAAHAFIVKTQGTMALAVMR